MARPSDEAFREALRGLLERTGLSMRALSTAFGRDPGYVAALLDPTRPSRARPTPEDLARASDATGIGLVELLEHLWGIDPRRLARELVDLEIPESYERRLHLLTAADRREIEDFIDFVSARRAARR